MLVDPFATLPVYEFKDDETAGCIRIQTRDGQGRDREPSLVEMMGQERALCGTTAQTASYGLQLGQLGDRHPRLEFELK